MQPDGFQSPLNPEIPAGRLRALVGGCLLVLGLGYLYPAGGAAPVVGVSHAVQSADDVTGESAAHPVAAVITVQEVDLAVEVAAAEQSEALLLDQAVQFIEPFEGRRHRAYLDSRGYKTVGVGFNLDRAGAADDILDLLPNVNYWVLRDGHVALTDAQIDTLLRYDVRRAIDTARRQVTGFDDLPRDAQLIVIDMTFNTGSLHKWRKFRAALERGDFTAAADAMHRSLWRRQTGQRARSHIEMMKTLSQG